jgi:hypothetical protein
MNLKSLLALFVFCLLSGSGLFAQATMQLELSVDKTVLSLPCRYHLPAKYRTCPDGVTVDVRARVKGKLRKDFRYEYVVSYGTIIGTGPNVTWDMTKEKPGTYEIKARIYDGLRDVGTSETRTIRIEQCADCNSECLECPNLTIQSSKESASVGEIVDFHLPANGDLKYRWKIVGGKIMKGQGTEHVTVRIDKKAKDSALITVDVLNRGFCFEVGGCPNHSEFQLPLGNRELE